MRIAFPSCQKTNRNSQLPNHCCVWSFAYGGLGFLVLATEALDVVPAFPRLRSSIRHSLCNAKTDQTGGRSKMPRQMKGSPESHSPTPMLRVETPSATAASALDPDAATAVAAAAARASADRAWGCCWWSCSWSPCLRPGSSSPQLRFESLGRFFRLRHTGHTPVNVLC